MFIDNYEISFIATQEKNIILNIHRNAINKRCCICFCSRSLVIAAAALFDTNNLYPVKYEMWLWGMSWKIGHSVLLPYFRYISLDYNGDIALTKITTLLIHVGFWLKFATILCLTNDVFGFGNNNIFCRFGTKHFKFENCW